MIYKNYKRRYDKASIYLLRNIFDVERKNVYVGVNTNWSVRRYQHRRRCNSPNDRGYNYPLYRCIRNTGGWENWVMEKIEDYPCNGGKELSIRENYWIHYYNSRLNKSNIK
jgi:hypothetical protein